MPIGIITNCLAVALGGLLGSVIKDRLPDSFKNNINMILGLSSMGMGIASVVLMENMPAVVLAMILGTSIGVGIKLGDRITAAAMKANGLFGGGSDGSSGQLVTLIVLFCASGTGIYGSLVSGMNGDHSILITKAILDFVTAMIFACSLGKVVSLIAVPQFIIMILLYLLAGVIYPLTTPMMINDFKACGGFIMIASGFRIIQLKMFPTADMIPSMILVMPLSWMWFNWIAALLS